MVALQSKNSYPNRDLIFFTMFFTSLIYKIKSLCNVLYLTIQDFSQSIPLWANNSPSYAFTQMTSDPLF